MKRRLFNRSVLILLIVLMIFSSFAALAGIPSPGKDFYYYDEAGIMTTETKSMLYTNGENLKKACGAQVVVLVVNSLGGMKIEDYAYAVINEWGVGDKDEENGVVLVIDEKGGEYRMTIGTGLERHMNSAKVQRLLDGYFQELFKEYKTDLAIRNLYKKLFEEISDIYKLNVAFVGGSDLPGEIMIYEEDAKEGGISVGNVILIAIILLIVISVIRSNMKKVSSARPGTASTPNTPNENRPVVIKTGSSGSFWRGFIAGSINSAHRNSRHFGSFGSGSFGSSSRSSTRSSGGSFRSGGFGGARGGGGGGRGIGGGGRR